jgi:serine/threonine protein kinase
MYKQRSNTLFVRQADDKAAVLEDFVAKSVIGKGSFGKVFLVQKKGGDRVFAMKSLRKDVILDFD